MKDDSQLQHDVLEELEWDPEVDHSQIGVTAKDGVVTLSGFVPDFTQKVAAEKAAFRVSGIRAVAQEIEVRFAGAPKISDAEIAKRIVDLFTWDAAIPEQALMAKVEHGWVTLCGEVEWNHQKDAAMRASGRIECVKGVSSQIRVRGRPSPLDVRDRIVAGSDAPARSSRTRSRWKSMMGQ